MVRFRDEVSDQDLNPGLSDSRVYGQSTVPHHRECVRVSIIKKVNSFTFNREEELTPLTMNFKVKDGAHPENMQRAQF